MKWNKAMKLRENGRRARRFARELAADGRGVSHLVEILIGLLVAVVIGSLLLAAMKVSIPQLFNDLMTKITGMFSGMA